jgi:hypothetical protein
MVAVASYGRQTLANRRKTLRHSESSGNVTRRAVAAGLEMPTLPGVRYEA